MPDLYTTCEYKNVNDCSIKCDVYPGNAGAPVAVFIHGGALIFGRRTDIPEASVHLLRKNGYWLVSIDYRLAPETKLPHIADDIREALEWVKDTGAKRFGYDAGKLIVIGASAGGYLALLSGTFDTKPNVLVSFYGYGDILGDWYGKPSPHYCKEPPISPETVKKAIKNFEHSEADNNDDRFLFYKMLRQTGTWTGAASGYDIHKERDKIERYCPILNITKDFPPVIFLHGDRDTDVPYQQSLDMYNTLKTQGLTAELITAADCGHGFDWNGNDPNVPGMMDRVFNFVKAHL